MIFEKQRQVIIMFLERHHIDRLLFEEYPYLLDPIFKLSRTEAKRRLACGGCPTIEKMFADIRAYNELPKTAWDAIDACLAKKARKDRSPVYRFCHKVQIAYDDAWDSYRNYRLKRFFRKIRIEKLPDELP